MKKVILFLSIIGVAFLMTSCLGETETQFSGSQYPAYITSTRTGTIYAQTVEGLAVTSQEIQQMGMLHPNSFVFIGYTWKESVNTVTTENIYNVTVSQISEDPLEQTILRTVDAPELETELPLKSFDPAFYGGPHFGYHWICVYSYEKGDGDKKQLAFYHNLAGETENEIIIDVRLEDAFSGGTVDKDQTNIPVAVNLRNINDYYLPSGSTSGSSKTVQVYFQYPRKESDGTIKLYKTPARQMVLVEVEE